MAGIDFGDRELFAQFEDGPVPVHIRFDETEENGDDNEDLQDKLQECEETMAHLRAENQELKRKLKLVSQPSSLVVEDFNVDGPLMQVLFMNNSISKQYHHEIEDFINYLVYKYKEEKRDNLESTSFNVEPQPSSVLLEDDHRQNVSRGIKKIKEAFNVVGSVLYFTSFCLDRLGQPLLNENPQLTEGWDVPKYPQTFSQIMALEGEEVVHAAKPKRPKPSCFNCGSADHQLRDCPEPRNNVRINEKRKEFNDMVGDSPSQNTNVRYHADETEERFGKFKAGIVSDELQKALGVTRKDLPPYIYRMRQLGYPPGWLKEAQLENSGLSLYHGNDAGDGEIEGNDELNSREKPFSYDLSKLIDYPGFNIDIPGGSSDDWRMFGSIPMQMVHQKEVFANYLATAFSVTSPPFNNKRAYDELNPSSKKKQKFTPSEVPASAVDMDVDSDPEAPYRTPDYHRFNFQPPLPRGSPMSTPPALPQGTPPATPPNFIPPPPPTPTPPPLPKDTPPLTPSTGSPRLHDREFSKSRPGRDLGDEDTLTLEELEEQQRLIWAALEQTDSVNSDSDAPADTPVTGSSIASSPTRNDIEIPKERAGSEKLSGIKKEDSGKEFSSKQPVAAVSYTTGSDNEASSGQSNLENDDCSAEPSKKIPQSVPDISKFATGITPFEYENMSEATGVYLRLRTLLKSSPRSQMKRQSL